MLNIAVFGSGRGSNFRAILREILQGSIPGAKISLVISNNSTAGILEHAREHGLPALHVSRKQFATDDEYDAALLQALEKYGANFIILAGYMKRLPPAVVTAYRNRILNIHPALLPNHGGEGMYGVHVHEAVLAAGDRVSGATVHLVDEEYDHGSIVIQKQVPVYPGDTVESLAARVLDVEHSLYPEAVRLFAEDRVRISDGHVTILPH